MRGTRFFSIGSIALLCTLAGVGSVKEFNHLSSADLPGPAYEAFSPPVGANSVAAPPGALPAPPPAMPGHFDLVGHEPLLYRGENSAIAVHGDYVYVGSRKEARPPRRGGAVGKGHDPG